MKKRKIIQITATASPDSYSKQHVWDCTALCDDGSLWLLANFQEWQRLPDIPQDNEVNNALNALKDALK
ncbi:hypothetical protein [Haemophilus sp. Marseille-Q0026]|jgi:hypothetical protein|uniref:hypothetical protein n=1 Tax=Haemophilus sp. Marseille-Q0026 TaxID=2866580 RepID=UPI001CF7EF40|nr:hypothetical protein [Haemophilus sp. Marseille-Q0026]DAQ59320.1 MAG TPA: hypothetical protein [Caudoviricetes sp.]DAW81253.1 MAG TPA: hypothetical protein [Caudoviricetes sp.]